MSIAGGVPNVGRAPPRAAGRHSHRVLRQLLRVTPQIQRAAAMIGDTVAHVLPTLAVPLEVAMLELDLCTIIRVRP